MPGVRALTFTAVAFNAILATFYLCFNVSLLRKGLEPREDFTAIYAGARMVREGEGPNLYDLSAQGEAERRYIAEDGRESLEFPEGVLPFINPPYATVPLLPLTCLPMLTASRVWIAFNLILIVYAGFLLLKLCEGWSVMERAVYLTACFALQSWTYAMAYGTLSIVILVCALRFYLALRRGDGLSVGAWLAGVAFKPQLALTPLLALAAAKKWKPLSGFCVVLAAACVAASFLCGLKVWPSYARMATLVAGVEGMLGVYPQRMPNFRGVLMRALGATLAQANTANVIASLAVAAFVVWAWRKEGDFDVKFALTLLLGMFVAPHLNVQELILLTLAAGAIYNHLRTNEGKGGRAFAVVAAAYPIAHFLHVITGYGVKVNAAVQIPIVVLTCWAMSAYALHCRRKQIPA